MAEIKIGEVAEFRKARAEAEAEFFSSALTRQRSFLRKLEKVSGFAMSHLSDEQMKIPPPPPPPPLPTKGGALAPPGRPIATTTLEKKMNTDEQLQIQNTLCLGLNKGKKRSKQQVFKVIFDWIVFLCVLGFLIASINVPMIKNYMIWRLEPWKWCVVFLVILSKPFIGLMMNVVVSLIDWSSLCNEKVLYYLYALRSCVRRLLWFGSILLVWFLLFDHQVMRSKRAIVIADYVTRCLASVTIGAALWVLKNLVVEILASCLPVARLFDRIKRSIIDQYILEILSVCRGSMETLEIDRAKRNTSAARLVKIRSLHKQKREGFRKLLDWLINLKPKIVSIQKGEGYNKVIKTKTEKVPIQKGEGDHTMIDWLIKMKPEEVSISMMKELIDMISDSGGLSSVTNELEKLVSERVDKKTNYEAKVNIVADNIFKKLGITNSRYVRFQNLNEFFEDETLYVLEHINKEAEIEVMFDKETLKKWLVNTCVGRKSLAQSLSYSRRAVSELNKICSGIVLTLSIIIWVLVMKFLTTEVFVVIITQFLLLGFMFGNTAKSFFEGIIFVFVIHPFDKNDCCLISGEELIVEEINLLTTVFLKNGKDKLIYPNSILANLPIMNYYESTPESDVIKDYAESVELALNKLTSKEKIHDLKAKIKEYLKRHYSQWHPRHDIVIKDVESKKKKLVLNVTHRNINVHNFEEMMSKRRSELVNMLQEILHELSIQYYHIQPQDGIDRKLWYG